MVLFVVFNQLLERNYKHFHWDFSLQNNILPNKIKLLRFWMRTIYATSSCKPGKMCGHYTQMVWKTSTKVGCAYAVCEDSQEQVGYASTACRKLGGQQALLNVAH